MVRESVWDMSGARLEHVRTSSITRGAVGQIDNHAKLVHQYHGLATKRRQSALFDTPVAAAAKGVFVK
jgi:hypothetical protein